MGEGTKYNITTPPPLSKKKPPKNKTGKNVPKKCIYLWVMHILNMYHYT